MMVRKISVVTPVLNDPRVGRALDSVLAQDLNCALEVIVIDGGSDDGTLDELDRRRHSIDVLVSEPDDGIFDGMNKGVERATGDIVGILNADDQYVNAHVLSDVADVFRNYGPDACYGNIVYEDADGRIVRVWTSGTNSPLKWRLGWMPPHPGFFVRRELYLRYGAFDTDLKIAADYELMLRLLYRHHISSAHIDRVLVSMEIGGESNKSVANILKAAIEVRRAWKMNGFSGGEIAALLKPMSKIIQYF